MMSTKTHKPTGSLPMIKETILARWDNIAQMGGHGDA
jgi:hypothetical protein